MKCSTYRQAAAWHTPTMHTHAGMSQHTGKAQRDSQHTHEQVNTRATGLGGHSPRYMRPTGHYLRHSTPRPTAVPQAIGTNWHTGTVRTLQSDGQKERMSILACSSAHESARKHAKHAQYACMEVIAFWEPYTRPSHCGSSSSLRPLQSSSMLLLHRTTVFSTVPSCRQTDRHSRHSHSTSAAHCVTGSTCTPQLVVARPPHACMLCMPPQPPCHATHAANALPPPPPVCSPPAPCSGTR